MAAATMPRDAIHTQQHRMTPQAFIAKWGPGGPAYTLNEEQGAQSHFIDLCDLLSVPRLGTEPGWGHRPRVVEWWLMLAEGDLIEAYWLER